MALTATRTRRRRVPPLRKREARAGLLWVQSWMIGFLLFTLIPIIAAIYLSFTDWQGIGSPRWIGVANYVEIFSADPTFWQSLKVTAIYTVLALPLGLLLGFGLALLMNQQLRGVKVFRTIYYLPSIDPASSAPPEGLGDGPPHFTLGMLREFSITQ